MYFITFTRKMGTGGSEIAKRVASELGYSFYDTEAIENAAREMGLIKENTERGEKVPSLFSRFFSKEPEIHLDRLNSVIYELASRGSAVFLGRGSHVLLRPFKCALHVRVTGSTEKRVENLVARGLPEGAALKAIHRSDHEREAFTKFAFHVDWENPELYDVVINMDNLSVDLAVDLITGLARTEEIRARSVDAMSSLRTMALARRSEAALMEAGFSMTRVSLSVPEPGRVRLTGTAADKSEAAEATAVLMKVEGVQSVANELEIVPGAARLYPM